MLVTRADIARGLSALGVVPGNALLIHSSLSSFGDVEGGADTVIDGAVDAVSFNGAIVGTVMVPTLTGHPDLSPNNPPHIDMRSTPCWTGLIPETLRKRHEAVRSIHPTHSCAAIGNHRAREFTSRHEWSPTPCGVLSPYYRLAAAGGKVVMMGCGLESCTLFHTVEELANVDYHLQPEVSHGSCIDADGNRIETPCRLHSYDGPERNFPIMVPILLARGFMWVGLIGDCPLMVVDAAGLIVSTLERLRENPRFLCRVGG